MVEAPKTAAPKTESAADLGLPSLAGFRQESRGPLFVAMKFVLAVSLILVTARILLFTTTVSQQAAVVQETAAAETSKLGRLLPSAAPGGFPTSRHLAGLVVHGVFPSFEGPRG